MDKYAQKRKAHHRRAKAARQHKFIALYTMHKNKDAYDEAKKFYEELDVKYGTKRDLTKTDEFTYKTTGYSVHEMYQINYKTKIRKNQGPKNQKEIAVNIPLMNQGDVDIAVMSEKVNEGISIPGSVYKELLDEISNDPTMRNIFGDLNQEQPGELDQVLDGVLSMEESPLEDEDRILYGILPKEKSPLEDELENIVYE